MRRLHRNNQLPFRYSEYLAAKENLAPLKAGARFYYMLFSESGFDEQIQAEADGVTLRLCSLEEIASGRVASGSA